jgi:hypothetical protein
MNVRLRIGELVLDGVPALDESLLLEALRDAVGARLSAGVPLPRSDAALAALEGDPLTPADGSPRALAVLLADAVSRAVMP